MLEINKIHHGDCLELMKLLPDNSIDLVVTSPPYDNLRYYDGYTFDFDGIAKELFRITKQGGVVVWVVGDATIKGSETGTSFKQALFFKEIGFNLHDTMIWEKDSFSFPNANRYRNVFEYMFIFAKGSPKTINLIEDRKNKYAGSIIHGTSRGADGKTFKKSNDKKGLVKDFGVRFNVWKSPNEKNNIFNHPAPFPQKIAKDHIISWSNEGDTILDPFMGSGTTALCCGETGRNFIGMEISQDYVDIANKRLQDTQVGLF